jgi:hypothetical protein
MKTILLGLFLTASANSAFAGMSGWNPSSPMIGTEDVGVGTVCKVKDIVVLAQSADDCVAIGGEATHTLVQSAKPVAK